MCFCYLHPITALGSTVLSLQFLDGGPVVLAFLCPHGDAEPVSSFPCLLPSPSQQVFHHAEIRFSLSIPLTHFRLFEGAADLPGGCSSAFGGHGRVVEPSGRNGSSMPKTCGRRVVLEVHPPLVCSPVFSRMFFLP